MLQHLQIRQNPFHHTAEVSFATPSAEAVTEATKVSAANLRELWSAFLDAVLNPGHHGVKNLLLTAHVELIAGNDINQLVGRQQHELFTFHDL